MELGKFKIFFENYKQSFVDNMLSVASAMLAAATCNTSEIALALSKINNQSFKTSDMKIYRLLDSDHFQIDDKLWRCYHNLIFSLLHQLNLITSSSPILLQIDFTSKTNEFLICCASIQIHNLAIPIYFTTRKYPVRKGMYDHKHMEEAFIKGLRHVLSKRYNYIVLADRGFGNRRFVDYCKDAGFDYLIRIQTNINFGITDTEKIYTHKNWRLISNMKGLELDKAMDFYSQRFKIEKVFQDLKSSGFDIEQSKIKKYSRFKRLLFLGILSYSLIKLIGLFISEKVPILKKNYPQALDLYIAYSKLEKEL